MLRVRTTVDTITSGAKEVADLFGGGIRLGSLILIEGESGSGKSILARHLVNDALSAPDQAIAYYATEYGIENIINLMDTMYKNVIDYLLASRLRIYPINVSKRMTEKRAHRAMYSLINHISNLPESYDVAIVDAISPIMMHITPKFKMEAFHAFKEVCDKKGRSIILVLNSHALEKKVFRRAFALSDYYMELRSDDTLLGTEQVDDRVIKTLSVLKLHGAERQGDSLQFEITPGGGVHIIPIYRIRV